MKLKNQLLLALGVILIVLFVGIWYYTQLATQSINERWAQKLIEKQLFFDKNLTLQPILQKTAITAQLIEEPSIIQMAIDPTPSAYQAGLATLETYRLQFQDHSYFAAFKHNHLYLYKDATHSQSDQPLQYKLHPNKLADQWFFKLLETPHQQVHINVNKDDLIGVTKVWINQSILHQGKVIGVLGTGFELNQFLKQNVDTQQPGIRSLFINDQLSIQLDKDTRLIQHSSFTKPLAEQENLSQLLPNLNDLATLKTLIKDFKLGTNNNQIQTFWSNDPNKPSLIGVTYLPEINWFNITLFAPEELAFLNIWYLIIPLIALLLLATFTLWRVNHALFITPLQKLTLSVQAIRAGKEPAKVALKNEAAHEINLLSKEFNALIKQVKLTQKNLEHQVSQRTHHLLESEKKLNTILDAVPAFIFIKDSDYKYVYANKTMLNFYNLTTKDIIGSQDELFIPKSSCPIVRENDFKVLHQGEKIIEEDVISDEHGHITLAYRTNKVPLVDEHGKIYGICGIAWNNTEQKRIEFEVKQQALYDNLTKLPNRRLLHERLKFAVINANRKQIFGALLFIDLDNFKPLNDLHGHDFGDLLLIEAGQRLTHCVPDSDTVARYGGDEFIVLLPEVNPDLAQTIQAVENLTHKLLNTINQPYKLFTNNHEVVHSCSVSIGIRFFKTTENNYQQIITDADQAMYQAKKEGKNRFQIYTNP